MVKEFKQGDIIYLDFGPQIGHEQKGKRPAVVISCDDYNFVKKNMIIAAPITSKEQKSIFCYELSDKSKTQGYVLCDQLKAIDTSARKIKHFESLDQDSINTILSIIRSIFSLQK